MSADNFYLITPHPTSGFAVLMGFASNEDEVLPASKKDKSYPTLNEAINYAMDEYSEYGVQVAQVAYDLDKNMGFTNLKEEIVGLSEEIAVYLVKKAEFIPRIVEREGNPAVITRDYKLDRVNLSIKDGLVYKASIG